MKVPIYFVTFAGESSYIILREIHVLSHPSQIYPVNPQPIDLFGPWSSFWCTIHALFSIH